MMTMESQVKLTQSCRMSAVIPLILAFTVLTAIVIDLDRPTESMIKVGQPAMIDLQMSLELVSE